MDARPADSPQEDELESYLAALAPETDRPQSDLAGRFSSAQVFQVRLPGPRIEQLRRLAQARGVTPTALLVDWVIERLDQEDSALSIPPTRLDTRMSPAPPSYSPTRNTDPLDPLPTHQPAASSANQSSANQSSANRFSTTEFSANRFSTTEFSTNRFSTNEQYSLADQPTSTALESPYRTAEPASPPASRPSSLPEHLPPYARPFPRPETVPYTPPETALPPPPSTELPSLLEDKEPSLLEDRELEGFKGKEFEGAEKEESDSPPATVTPLFRGAHAARSKERPRGPRHRAPEPVTNLLSRRKR